MRTKFHYILIFFVVAIVYLIYLISRETYSQFQVDTFITDTEQGNSIQEEINALKQAETDYNQTLAYKTLVAKNSLGRANNGEMVVYIVDATEANANSAEDTRRILAENQKKVNNPLRNMDNPQKWNFIFQHGVAKFQEYNTQ